MQMTASGTAESKNSSGVTDGIDVRPYSSEHQRTWDQFVRESANATFLLERGYMDYHADRFPDASLMMWRRDALVAVLPGTITSTIYTSHRGLTYGGLIFPEKTSAGLVLECLRAACAYLRDKGLTEVIYKAIPAIYHRYPAESDLYGLFRHDARIERRELSAAIDLRRPLAYSTTRRQLVSKARKSGMMVVPSEDYDAFFGIASEVLQTRHNARPTHTAAEMKLLASRFPANITLYSAHGSDANGPMLAGVITYRAPPVLHVQYIASSEDGKVRNAADLIIDSIIEAAKGDAALRWFEFGISTEEGGRVLNAGLMQYKEMFGARGIVYDTYKLPLTAATADPVSCPKPDREMTT